MRARVAADERSRAIIDATLRLFARNGFDGTTTREIALAAGVSEALVYKHFPDKRSLYRAVLQAKIQDAERSLPLDGSLDGLADDEFFFHVASTVLRRVEADDTFLRLFLRSALEGHPLAREFHAARIEKACAVTERRVRRILGPGSELDARLAARTFHGMILAATIGRRIFKDSVLTRASVDRHARTIAKLFHDGLLGDAKARRKAARPAPRKRLTLVALLLPTLLAPRGVRAQDRGSAVVDSATDTTPSSPLTLSRALGIAAPASERVLMAEESLEQSLHRRRQLRAALMPQLTLIDDYYLQDSVQLPPPSGTTGNAITFADSRNQLRLNLDQPLLGGLRDRALLRASRASTQALELGVAEEERRLRAGVARAFYGALGAQVELGVRESAIGLSSARAEEMRARRDVGLARSTEVLLVEARLAEDEAAEQRATNDLALARDVLTFDVPGSFDSLQDDLAPPPASLDLEATVVEALGSRPDVRAAQLEQDAAQLEVSAARAGLWPSLGLSADYYVDRDGYSTFAQETNWSAEITLAVPVFDGGLARADVAAARSRAEQAKLGGALLRRQVRLEVESAWLALQSDRTQVERLEAATKAAEEAHRLLSEEFREGLATNVEVLTAEDLLLSTRLALERARLAVKLDWALLQLAAGRSPHVLEAR